MPQDLIDDCQVNTMDTNVMEGLLPLLQEAFHTFQMHPLELCQMSTMKGHQ